MSNKTFVLELTKVIVVEIKAKNEQEARELVGNNNYEDDGAWERAESQVVVLETRGNGKPKPAVLSEKNLVDLGYRIVEDPDQPMRWLWLCNQDASETSFASKAEAIADATRDAFETFEELSRCDNCGKVHSDQTLVPARHLSMRVDPNGVMPSGECPDCGALCYLLKA